MLVHGLVVGPIALALWAKVARLPGLLALALAVIVVGVAVPGIIAAVKVRRGRRALARGSELGAGPGGADTRLSEEEPGLRRHARSAMLLASLGSAAWTWVPMVIALGLLIARKLGGG